MGHEQPSAETLLHGVKLVADSGLGDLHNQGVGVLQQDTMQNFVAPEFLSKEVALQTECVPRNLNHGPECRRLAQKPGHSDDAFVAHNADLDRLAVDSPGQIRHDRILRQVQLTDACARFIKHGILRQHDRFKLRGNHAQFSRRYCFEDAVLHSVAAVRSVANYETRSRYAGVQLRLIYED